MSFSLTTTYSIPKRCPPIFLPQRFTRTIMKSRGSKRPKPISEPYLAPGKYHEKAVVSSFIFAPKTMQDNKFALFKRNPKVKNYPGKWAVCTGSIEEYDPTPIDAAKREILEETALPESEFSLMVHGKPYTLKDEKLRTKWTIHPFSWRLARNPKPIRLDWEHEEFRFITPKELRKFDHVSQLELGLNRVILSEETEDNLSDLRSTPFPTTVALAQLSLTHLSTSLTSGFLLSSPTTTELWRELRWKCWHFVNNSPPSISVEDRAGIKEVLATVLDEVAKILEASSTKEIEGKEIGEVKRAIAIALKPLLIDEGREEALSVILEGAAWEGGDGRGDGVWDSVMEDL